MPTDAPSPLVVVQESASVSLRFNVMPGREVRETIFIHQYSLSSDYIECRFDREYSSEMLNSPDHLIFLSALVHLQKLIYVLICHKLELPYHPDAPERIKIWPYKVSCDIPKLIRDSTGLVQTMQLLAFTKKNDASYNLHCVSSVNGSLGFEAQALVLVLGEEERV